MNGTGFAVLAGGRASRMDHAEKPLALLGGRTFISYIAEECGAFEERLFIGGNPLTARENGFRYVEDMYKGLGPAAGILTALKSAESGQLLVLACDMPFYRAELGRLVIAEHDPSALCTVCRSDDGRIHPLCGLYSKDCIPFLEDAVKSGRLKMKDILAELRCSYYDVPGSLSACLVNINTYGELNRASDIPRG